MISYAGVDLVEIFTDLDAHLRSWSDVKRRARWLARQGPGPGLERAAWPGTNPAGTAFEPGVLHWPLNGACRFAHGSFVIHDAGLAEIRLAVGATGIDISQPLLIDDGRKQVEFQLRMLPARPVCQPDSPAQGLYILDLVDLRYFWWFRSSALGDITTWDDLFAAAEDILGVTIDRGVIDDLYGDPPDDLLKDYHSLPVLLDAAARSVGCRLVFNYDGTVELLSADESIARYQDTTLSPLVSGATRISLAGGELATGGPLPGDNDDAGLMLPARVVIAFPRTDTEEYTYAITVALTDLGLEYLYGSDASFDGEKLLRSTALADFCAAPGDADPDNVDELQALADQLAEDYYKHLYGRHDVLYEGALEWPAEGLTEAANFTHKCNRITTRVYRSPFADHAEDLYHQAPSNPALCPTGATITVEEEDGTPSYPDTSTLQFDQTDGFVVSSPSTGVTLVNFTFPGFTVEEVDSSPSYTGITTLRFDQADGFIITNPSTGVARIDFSGGGGGSGITVKETDGTPSYASTTTLQFDQEDGFVVSQPAGSTAEVDLLLPNNTQTLGSPVDVTDDGASNDVLSISIPGAGVYLIISDGWAEISVDIASGSYISMFLDHGFSGTRDICYAWEGAGSYSGTTVRRDSFCLHTIYTASGAVTVKLQAIAVIQEAQPPAKS